MPIVSTNHTSCCQQLGVTTAQIVNSLIFEVKVSNKQREGVLVCAPGDRRVDRAKLAAALGVSKAKVKSASAEAVLRYTGYQAVRVSSETESGFCGGTLLRKPARWREYRAMVRRRGETSYVQLYSG